MKRRSSTNTPPDLGEVFFADRNLGKEFVRKLRAAGLNVEAHADHFPRHDIEPEIDDREWIAYGAGKGWILLSNDKSISRNYPEVAEVMNSGGEMFVPEGKKRPSEFADLIIRTKTGIQRHLKGKRKLGAEPFISKIGFDPKDQLKPGKVKSWMTEANWVEKTSKRIIK